MPWSPIALLAIVTGIVQWRRDARVRSLLVWCAAIFLPLCVTANKQDHYLLPMMPPLAMLAGWWLNSLSESEQPGFAHHVTNLVIFATVVILAIAALALPSLARHARGDILSTDLVMAAALLGGTLILWFVMRRRTRAGRFVVFSIAMALILTVTLGFWAPTLQTRSPRDVAAEIRSLGGDAYCFYGENLSLPLVFELRQIVPQITSTPELVSLARHRGRNLMVIAQTKADVAPPRLPANFVRVESIETKDQKFEIYRAIK
jgi:4-amino-4-deoxy-L-arabinose transferase-like glycosyltransferase